MEGAIQIALQEEYTHRQARTPRRASSGAVQGALATGDSTGLIPMELGTAVQSSIRCYGCGKLGKWLEGPVAEAATQEPGELGSPVGAGRPTGEDLSPHGRSADGARHGGLAPESLGALETRKSSGGLLVVHASVRGYGDPFRILIDSGASTNFARRQTVTRNGDKYADALRETKGRGQVSMGLADGTVVNVPGHEPWIDWRGKAIGASRPAVSDRALVSNVPTSVRDWGARDGRQGAYAPEEVLGSLTPTKVLRLATGRETKAHCQSCGIATTASPNAESRRA
ncbi:LOW QUALITY PROTEIN: hypothetical protein PHPALM_27704, partial [Phytophthora palmivora]